MKYLIVLLIFQLKYLNCNSQIKGNFVDNRDNYKYKTVKIGNQTWFAENLKFKAENGCFAYDDNENNVKKYGYLYNFETAKKVCPIGWHLSSRLDWDSLFISIGGSLDIPLNAKYLCKRKRWNKMSENFNNEYINKYNFNAVPSGIKLNGDTVYRGFGYFSEFWTSSKLTDDIDDKDCLTVGIGDGSDIFILCYQNEECLFSVRCVKDKD